MTGPSFIAFVHDAGDEALVDEIAVPRRPAHIRRLDLAEGRLTLCLWAPAGDQVGQDGPILVDVNGTRSTTKVPVPARFVAADAAANDMSARASQFHSYLFLDSQNRAAVWTDHVGFSKIFHAAANGCQIFSDDLSVFAALGRAVDMGMVASYLLNGSMLANRTLYDGVRNLAPGTVSVARPGGLQVRPYWRFEPGVDPDPDLAGMGQELWSRTKEAILCHTGEHGIVLPLSGGNDSACLLGVLSEARRELTTFTFVNGAPRRGSDADVARRQAQYLGVGHEIYGIEGASFLEMLKANVGSGLIMRNANYEIFAYAGAADAAKGRLKSPIFCFGDECFGRPSYRTASNNDLLGAIELKEHHLLTALQPAVGSPTVARLRTEMEQVYRSILDGLPPDVNNFDICDRLYFNVRRGMNLVPLRVHTAGWYLPFACPFQDIGLLDMMRRIPSKHRLDRSLYKAVVRHNLPELFRIPRSRFDQTDPDLGLLLRTGEREVREYLSGLGVGIPGVVTPADLQALFAMVVHPVAPHRSVKSTLKAVASAARNAAKAAATSGVIPARLKTQIRLRTFNKFEFGPDPVTLFQRALQLAMTFEEIEARNAAFWPTGRDRSTKRKSESHE